MPASSPSPLRVHDGEAIKSEDGKADSSALTKIFVQARGYAIGTSSYKLVGKKL